MDSVIFYKGYISGVFTTIVIYLLFDLIKDLYFYFKHKIKTSRLLKKVTYESELQEALEQEDYEKAAKIKKKYNIKDDKS